MDKEQIIQKLAEIIAIARGTDHTEIDIMRSVVDPTFSYMIDRGLRNLILENFELFLQILVNGVGGLNE